MTNIRALLLTEQWYSSRMGWTQGLKVDLDTSLRCFLYCALCVLNLNYLVMGCLVFLVYSGGSLNDAFR